MNTTDGGAIELLRGMLRTPSPTGGEDAVAALLLDAMTEFGYRDVHRDDVGNVLGEIGASSPALSVVLLGHMDTVPGEIPVEIRDGVLYGRGAVDAKGPLATAVVAAARAAEHTPLHLTVIGAVQEEGPSLGARHLVDRPAPTALIICEPGGWDSIVLGYKGSQRFTVRITVPMSHSAGQEPTATESAFAFYRRLVEWCESHGSPDGPSHHSFYRLTPTLMSANSDTDGLYDTSTLHIGLRLLPGLEPAWVQEQVRTLAPEAHFAFNEGEPAFRSGKNTPIVGRFLRAIRDEGGTPRFKLKTGTSDMNVVGPAWQCETVAYGPGDSSLDHTPQEHIRIDEYLQAIRVLSRALEGG
jgi:LysW-gamma-L-lysine carboxypeptidase